MADRTSDPGGYGWDRENHDRRQVRLGLELSPAERLRWLEETMDELGRLVEQARLRRKGTTTIKRWTFERSSLTSFPHPPGSAHLP
jgi:hypothetical protein